MIKMNNRRFAKGGMFCLIFIGMVMASFVYGQSGDSKANIGLAMSAVKMVGGEGDYSMISPWLNLTLGYGLSEKIGLELNGGFGWDRAFDDEKDFPIKYLRRRKGLTHRTLLYPVILSLKYSFKPDNKISPYAVGGMGVLFWDYIDVSGGDHFFTGLRFGKSVYGMKSNLLFNIGAGLQWFFRMCWALDLSLRYQQFFNRDIDMTGFDDINMGNIECRLGLTFHFGGPRDSDYDGILDRMDNCPKEAEDFDGFQDTDGCPDLDNDEDGIVDTRDQAPNDAEDIDGFEDEDGIPDLDNDGDGLPDSKDKDPNTAEDLDGFEDDDGVPDLDNDGDKIPDAEDLCPNEPETFNDFEDEDGCPDQKPEMMVPEEQSMIMQGVNFSSGSARLSEISRDILNKLYSTMRDNPKMRVEIQGYTDSIGSESANIELSRRRADAVRDYLIHSGIDASRIVARGFGETDPVASNQTKAGRAMNRRIEIIRID